MREDIELFIKSDSEPEFSMIRDWRKALKSQPSYYHRSYRVNFQIIFFIMCIIGIMFILYFLKSSAIYSISDDMNVGRLRAPYNYTYPISAPTSSNGVLTYRIALIADLDKESRDSSAQHRWRSYLKKGSISYNAVKNSVSVLFDDTKPLEINGGYSLNGRGMELSELVTFNGRILTFDDRTGIVYEIKDDKAVAWVILVDGNGWSQKGFKSEWATVKDEVLFVGSMGKEWTTSAGEFESFDPMYVKAITSTGEVIFRQPLRLKINN